MVRKNFVGAPLLREKYIKDAILAVGIIPNAMLIGTQLSNFEMVDFLLVISFFCFLASWIIYNNKYIDRAYKLREEWK